MWQEYAIEPAALVRSLKEFNGFNAGLGWEQGRLLAKFPGDYTKLVHEALAASPEQDIKRATIESRLQGLFEKSLIRTGRAAVGDNWVEKAKAAHAIEPFHALITLVAAAGTVSLDDFDPSSAPWTCPGDCVVQRSVAALADAAKRVFNHSAQVHIIDPHFAPQKAHVAPVLEAYLDSRNHTPGSPFQLSIHAGRTVFEQGPMRPIMTPAGFEAAVRTKVSAMLRSGQCVTVHIWDEISGGERFHDRYILSKHGGLSMQGGADTGPAVQTTTLSRVSSATAGQILDRFTRSIPGGPARVYDLVHKFEVR